MLKKQKIIKNKQKFIAKHVAKIQVRHWVFPAATTLLAFLIWFVLSFSKMASRGVGSLIDQSPKSTDNPFIPLFLAVLFLVAASIYFYIDYKQHLKPFEQEGLASAYNLSHHVKVVFIPRLKYNWRQTIAWTLYGLLSVFMISYIVAVHTAPVFAYAPNEFVTTWQTNPDGYSGPTKQITIPTTGSGYNYTVDWGDGAVVAGYTGNATHDYAAHGVYTIKITGSFPRIDFSGYTESNKLLTVEQWGTNHWSSMEYAFYNATNLTVPATDVPDLSGITSMEQMFAFTAFNQDINNWDVSTVTNMRLMFSNTPFNQPLNSWNTSSVTDMTGMFIRTPFNKPLNSWDVSSVTYMNSMFSFNSSFNQPLNSWNTSSVTNMFWMFRSASAFNQSLGNWNVSNVTDMSGILNFAGLSAANYDDTLIGWSGQSLKSSVTLDAFTLKYCSAAVARANIISTYAWTINDSGQECPAIDFTNSYITTWKTDNDGDSPTNQINLIADGVGAYDYSVDWGDGNVDSNITGNTTHSYLTPGTYTVKITGTFPRIRTSSGDAPRILSVEQWGNNHWGSMNAMFTNAHNLRVNASDAPDLSGVTDMSNMFSGAWVLNDNINSWNISNVTNLQGMFRYAYKFNQPLSSWDTSSVTEMREMFYSAGDFNQDISSWNISKVTSLAGVFWGAQAFNQPLNSWNVGGVTNMTAVFAHASSFNQPLNSWDTSGVTDMNSMFYGATAFNQQLNTWNTSSVTNMSLAFASALSFNQDISAWDTGLVTNFMGMFYQASAFNQPLNSWNMQSAQSIGVMFSNATSFNQPLNSWNVSNVQDMAFVFDTATSFNQPLNSWNTGSVNTMYRMFVEATSFNQPLGSWDMSNVVYADSMLNNTAISRDNYDSTLIGWAAQSLQSDVLFNATPATYCSSATERQAIISGFNWTINDGGEDCSPPVDFTNAFITTWKTDNPGVSGSNEITIPTVDYLDFEYNYNVDWGDGTVEVGLTGDATHTYATEGLYTVKIVGDFPSISLCLVNEEQNGIYTDAKKLLTIEQWGNIQWETMDCAFGGASNLTITATDAPDLSSVTSTRYMFYGATSFNQDINSWGTGNVTDMDGMFSGATSFNQPLNNWDVSNVTTMGRMFYNATSFNQPLDNWDTGNVTYMNSLFNNATSFDQNINSWDVSNVTSISFMFARASSFNQPLNNWDTSSVSGNIEMEGVFGFATSFNQDISSWDVSNVEDMYGMFWGATSFNQPLNDWDTSNVRVMGNMFMDAESFNQDINNWDTSNVYYFMLMFAGATSFNQPLNDWDTSSGAAMTAMFAGASSFDQSLAGWDVSRVGDMSYMFNKEYLHLGVGYDFAPAHGLSTANYDATLASWSNQQLANSVNFDAGLSTYCSSANKRSAIINDFKWTINDSGEDCSGSLKYTYTNQPDKLSSSQARLKGSISGPGAHNFVSGGFEWGTSISYGSFVSDRSISGNNFSVIVDLDCDTQYYYRAFAVDENGNKTYGENTTFTLSCEEIPNETQAPKIVIVSPKPGEGFKTGSDVKLKADASAEDGIKEVRFYIDGRLVGTATDSPYEYIVKELKDGEHTLIAAAEGSGGKETSTAPLSFFISKKGGDLPLGVNSVDSFDKTLKGIEQNMYAFSGLTAFTGRNISVFTLLLLALIYLWQAYLQVRQNQKIRQEINSIKRIHESLSGFLHIVTHYLGTPVATMSLALEALTATKPNQVTSLLTDTMTQLKKYVNNLISELNDEVEPIKKNLTVASEIKQHSLILFVIVPITVAMTLTVLTIIVAPLANLWGVSAVERAVDGVLLVFGAGLTVYLFKTWQKQRQLNADLKLSQATAEGIIARRQKFIISNKEKLHQYSDEVRSSADGVTDSTFAKHFYDGVEQLSSISLVFGQISSLLGSKKVLPVGNGQCSVEEELAKLKPLASQSQVELVYEGESHPVPPFNTQDFEFIIGHLVDNALHFSNPGSRVYVSAKHKAKHFILRVADTGRGIESEKVTTLMQPFARATSTETYDYEGLGLSLYIVRLIVEKYGGKVDILSHEEKGTVITITV